MFLITKECTSVKQHHIRKLLLVVALLLFPVTIYYFSPALIINAGLEGVVNGSFIVFALLMIGSIPFGRLFCAYLCPAGGLQECLFAVNNRSVKPGWKHKIKYLIWGLWLAAVIASYVVGKGIHKIDLFYQTVYGVSVAQVGSYIIYYGIVLLIAVPAVIGGKRSFCHYLCWMAPFMAVGLQLRRRLHLPGIKIVADHSRCISCKKCNQACPMSINVEQEIKRGAIHHIDCIQCGDCKSSCPQKLLRYKITRE